MRCLGVTDIREEVVRLGAPFETSQPSSLCSRGGGSGVLSVDRVPLRLTAAMILSMLMK